MKKVVLILLVISSLFIIAAKKSKPSGLTGYEINQQSSTVASRAIVDVEVYCTGEKLVLGGGANTLDDPTSLEILESYPDATGVSWHTHIQNSGLTSIRVTTYAICADVFR
jgi:hypothetical protein